MIEAIIKHIQDRGFEVGVLSQRLLIRKVVGNQQFGYSWAISKWDLNCIPLAILLEEADRHLQEIQHVIANEVIDKINI